MKQVHNVLIFPFFFLNLHIAWMNMEYDGKKQTALFLGSK